MSVRDTMERKLRDAFAPERLEIIDDSQRHAGHAGAHPEGESHFRLEMVSAAFEGKSRVERQRMVYAVLSQELQDRVHALNLRLFAPGENNRNF